MVDTTCENIIPENTEKVSSVSSHNETDFSVAPSADSKDSNHGPLATSIDEKNQDSWTSIQSELKSALNSWADLSVKLANRKSPEELQLNEVRSILKDLKTKLKDFEE